MKKKKFWKLALLMVIIAAIVCFILFTKNKEHTSSKVENTNLISNNKAVLYYSTPIEKSKSKSLAIFISNDNKASVMEMDGLEAGTLLYNTANKTLLLEDKNSLKLVTDDKIDSKKFKNPEYTGQDMGYLSKNNTFYSLNNTGVRENSKTGQYITTLRYSNKQGTDSIEINDWATESTNNGKDTIYSFTDILGDETDEYEVVQSKLGNDNKFHINKLSELSFLSDKEDVGFDSNLVYSKEKLYVLTSYTDKQEKFVYGLLTYDVNTKKYNFEEIEEYHNKIIAPFSVNNITYMKENKLYFVDYDGNIIQIDVNDPIPKVLYNLFDIKDMLSPDDSGITQAKFINDALYIIYENKKGKVFLEKLKLTTGQTLSSDEIFGIQEVLNKEDSMYSYDFTVLED